MKLKFFLVLGISALISCGTHGQDHSKNETKSVGYDKVSDELKAQFTSDLSNYLDAFNNGDWDAVLDMIYPKLFDIISKEQMRLVFLQMEEMEMEMQTDFNKVERISEVINYESLKFCRVYYNGGLSIKIRGLMLENKELLKQSFIDTYGRENVEYDDEDNKFEIEARKSMIAISKIDSNQWSYIEYNEQQDEVLKLLIPDKVLAQIMD